MLKVAIILKDFSIGGGPRAVYHQCKSMKHINFYIFGEDGELVEEFQELPNSTLITINKWSLVSIYKIRSYIKINDIKIIHVHHLFPAIFFLLKVNHISRIITLHGIHIKKYFFKKQIIFFWIRWLLTYYILKKYEKIIVLTDNDKKFIKNLYPKIKLNKIHVIPNCFVKEFFLDCSEKHFNNDYFNLLMVARFDYPKGHDIFIDMLEKVNINNIKIYFIGDDKVKKYLEERKVLSNNIVYLGKIVKPYNYIQEADAIIIPSRWEGFPMVALEALSLGTRVIASDNSNLSVLEDGKNVFIFKLNNIKQLKKCIMSCINEKKQPIDINLNDFSPDIISSKILELYKRLV